VPQHRRDEAVLRPFLSRLRRDELAVPHHRNPVGEEQDLVKIMRDVDHGHALLPETPDDLVETLPFLRAQRRRRLVHDQETVIGRQCAHDLEHLLARDR
jgi:hypothetical protein